MAWSERAALKRSLAAIRDFATLALFEAWEDFHDARTSPITMGGWR